MSNLVVKDCRALLTGRLVLANIHIHDGKIRKISRRLPSSSDRVIDAKGLIAIPGLVDAHAHLYDPTFTNREDFRSGTVAAAFGGVTSVVEMVLQAPVDSAERVRRKIAVGKRDSLIDFSLHAGMMNAGNLANIPEILALGVRSFKAFMCKPYYADTPTLQSLLDKTARREAITNVHAEDEELANLNQSRLMEEGRKDPLAHAEWKTNAVEARAVSRAIELARRTRARLHISHMSTREGVRLVSAAKRRRLKVTAETCPHYLTFTRRDIKRLGPYLKMNPALKGPSDVAALWRGLNVGQVDIVTSEHAPGEHDEKEIGWTDIWRAWGGVPTIETMLPVLLSEGVNKGRISLGTLVRTACRRPADIFGLRSKGRFGRGADGDVVLIDLKLRRKVRAEDLHYKIGWTPYEGKLLRGWPVTTIRRGQTLVKQRGLVAGPSSAEFLPMRLS